MSLLSPTSVWLPYFNWKTFPSNSRIVPCLFSCRRFLHPQLEFISPFRMEGLLKRVNLFRDIDFTTHSSRYTRRWRVGGCERKYIIKAKTVWEDPPLRRRHNIDCRGLSEAIKSKLIDFRRIGGCTMFDGWSVIDRGWENYQTLMTGRRSIEALDDKGIELPRWRIGSSARSQASESESEPNEWWKFNSLVTFFIAGFRESFTFELEILMSPIHLINAVRLPN